MATFDALDLSSRPIAAGGAYGNGISHSGRIAATQHLNGDIFRLLMIPAGSQIDVVTVGNDDLDSNGSPTAAGKVGFVPVNAADGPAANDAYWAAAGQTFTQAPGVRQMNALPIKFDFDVYLVYTATANSATFAAGNIWAAISGQLLGVK